MLVLRLLYLCTSCDYDKLDLFRLLNRRLLLEPLVKLSSQVLGIKITIMLVINW